MEVCPRTGNMLLRKSLVFLVTFLLVGSASVFAGPIVFTDTTSDVPGSVFTLSITPAGGQNYSATLTVDTVATSPSWYIDYMTLDLNGGKSPAVSSSSLSFQGGGPGNWNIVPGGSDVGLLKKKHFPQNSKIGFYVNGIAAPNHDVTEGVLLDGLSATWSFDFTLAAGSILSNSPSIQVGYFNYESTGRVGKGGTLYFTQMSQTATSVPEPSTLILLLSSIGVLGGGSRIQKEALGKPAGTKLNNPQAASRRPFLLVGRGRGARPCAHKPLFIHGYRRAHGRAPLHAVCVTLGLIRCPVWENR